VAKIRQTGPAYFNVTVQAVEGGELRFYIVRWHEIRKQWIVAAPGTSSRSPRGQYEVLEYFRADRQRDALAYAVRQLTVDWVEEVGNAA